jgi:glycosyltransferase involved in cell wall biosynthesis
VTDDCGCGEWIRAAGAGRLVPYGDPRALAAAIQDRDPERDRALTARGAAFCRERFNWKRVAAEMVEYYREVLG